MVIMDFVDEFYADKDLSLLKKLTVVIPTYNRNYYLSRVLWYHAHFPFGQIIIADSSPEKKKIVNRETVAKISKMFGVDVLYLESEFMAEKYGHDITIKLRNAMQHVCTPYVQQISDRDFLHPETLQLLLEFLDNNKDYDVADADWYNITTINNRIIAKKTILTKYTLSHDDPLIRFLSACVATNGSSNLTAIRRTELNKKMYEPLIDNNLHDARFGEFTWEFLTIINSKIYYLPRNELTFKDFSNISKNGRLNKEESSNLRLPTFTEYIECGLYDTLFQKLKSCLINEMIKNGSTTDEEELSKVLDCVIPVALERRGFYGATDPISKILSKHPMLSNIAKFILSTSMKYDDESKAGKLVQTCIIMFNKYHKLDSPIL